jgi:hypothetical protein
MRLHRNDVLRFIFRLEPRKLAIANGLRGMLALGVPMAIAQLTDNRESGLLVALMAYFVNLTNVGGPYRIKATAMAAATFGMAISVFVGTSVAGVPELAVPLTLLWGLGSGLAWVYGDAGSVVGLVVGISFIFAVAAPGNFATALTRAVLCSIGGGWAMLDHQQVLSRQAVNDYSALEMQFDQILRRATALHSALVRLDTALQNTPSN